MKPVVLALVGPTGVGKTDAAIHIAKALQAEIVSMDSMQIYTGMDIGTAKPTQAEQSVVAHHLIDIADPKELFTVSAYRDRAIKAIENIRSRDKYPILVGGTGLYLQALSYEMNLGINGADDEFRQRLRCLAEEPGGAQKLHDRLREVDPESASKLHPHDLRRVIRALEIYETSGKTKGEQREEQRKEGPYHVLVYGLSLPRKQMYEKINARVDRMMELGLVDEVRGLLSRGVEPRQEGGAMQAIGYKEIVSALRGEIDMERAVELIKQNSRRYAKRQWTWFRHDTRTQWFDWSEYESKEALLSALLCRIQADLSAYLAQTD